MQIHFFQVVHNYGHGANGISMSWGTSLDAAELVKDALLSSKLWSLTFLRAILNLSQMSVLKNIRYMLFYV